MTMPGFTAEAVVLADLRARGTRAPVREVHAVSAQQRTSMRVPDTGGGTLEPATTCTCPCCQTIRGHLVCC